MTLIADLHIHSKYSRATSRDCVPEQLDLWSRRKGIGLLGTGDFTHALWREELREKLVPAEEGLYALRPKYRLHDIPAPDGHSPRFVITGELSSIYKKNGRVRKIHNLILLPGLEAAETLCARLEQMGMNLHSDGRPILGLDSRDLLEITLECCDQAVFIPAHIWTPHFSLFGAYSGFDTLEECFEDLSCHIHALETGLSSDPPMNWRVSMLDQYALVSNSDAHSPANLGREANLLNIDLSYSALRRALTVPKDPGLAGTLEFFPEEGKYHCDGHRACGVCLQPSQTNAMDGLCPSCGKKVTVGVLHRAEELADRPEGGKPDFFRPFESLVPLPEVIASSTGLSAGSVKVRQRCDELVRALGSEFFILREAPLEAVAKEAGPCVAEGIRRLRTGALSVFPGYDGEYGKVQILTHDEIERLSGQLSLLDEDSGRPAFSESEQESASTGSAAEKNAYTPSSSGPSAVSSPAEQLNAAQQEAVCAAEPAVAVIAGPGTGKTKTLVARIAYLVETLGVPPSQITAVTFTNKAAREVRARLETRFADRRAVKALTIGTFHSICLKQQRKKKQRCSVLSDADALSVMTDVLSELGCETPPKEMLRRISQCKNGTDQAAQWPELTAVWDSYHARLRAFHAVDYDDILLEGLEDALQAEPSAASPFSYLLVDEFQDINDLQYRLIEAWSRGGKSLFIIGDPDQSIYGFRGSDSQCFARFFASHPGARRICLTENYRCTPEILRCALPVIRAPGEAPRQLHAMRPSASPVRLVKSDAGFGEALFTVKEIGSLVGGIGMLEAHDALLAERSGPPLGFSDIAILYRTHRQAALFEECLQKDGIPYIVAGREDFLADPQVRGALAFLRWLLDPSDLLSLRTVLRCCGLPEKELLAHYHPGKNGCAALCVQLAALSEEEPPLFRLLQSLSSPGRMKPEKLLGLWTDLLHLSGYGPLEQLMRAAVLYRQTPEFLEDLLFGQESDVQRSGARKITADAVSLMTLHAAKGLEFPVVFLAGVQNGLIPFRREGLPADLEEERRLFYVGMTRAKDLLYLLSADEPSPFLASIPSAGLLKQSPPRKKPQGKQITLFD